MHPALSVIFFTTLSGAGYGVLFWAALAALTGGGSARALLLSTLLALALVSIGLLSSLAHLGKPQRAWRAFSQWRTSWLSREGVAAVVTYVPALLFAALLLPAMLSARPQGEPLGLNAAGVAVCAALMACALATIACTAMIYASLTPIPAWRHRLVVPGYLGFALLSGGLLVAAFAAIDGAPVGNTPAMAGIALAVAMGLLKWRYWRDIDRKPLPATRGAAVGLPQRTVAVFERPHTEDNYLTREMAFVVARRHSKRLRLLALSLFTLLPLPCLLAAWWLVHLDAGPGYAIAALSVLAGAFVERWLFFAEARHMVTLYY
jgi:DMSO reductase anchor subunit